MKTATKIFIIVIILLIALSSCGPEIIYMEDETSIIDSKEFIYHNNVSGRYKYTIKKISDKYYTTPGVFYSNEEFNPGDTIKISKK